MSGERAPEIDLMVDEIAVTPAAAAVLEFTSDIGGTKKLGELTYITSKDAYIWAGMAAFMATFFASQTREGEARFIEDIEIHAEIYKTITLQRN